VAHAQAEIVGKVVDTDGKPIINAEVSAANTAFPDRVYKTQTDKKGSYFLDGLLYAPQAINWKIAIKADGWAPVSVKTEARDSTDALYLADETKLTTESPSTVLKIRSFAKIRMNFVMENAAAAAAAAKAAAEAAAAAIPAVAGSDSYAQAVDKVRSGDPDGSVDLFKKAIEEKPDDWERRNIFASVLLRLDRQGEATIQANKAAQLAPDKAAPQLTLTDIYLARGLSDKASEAVGKAKQLEPDNPKVVERAAAVAAASGNLDDAIALTEKVVAANPKNADALISLASLYNQNKQPKKAQEALDKVVALDPQNAYRTFYNQGVLIENKDDATEADHRKAIEAFRQAIARKSDYAIAHRELGLALVRVGDMAGARKELQKYVDLAPQAKDAADMKSMIKSLESAK
jgi:tetratricopeptide (TPR) repeat protein